MDYTFRGREFYKQRIDAMFSDSGMQTALVYGRRRIGKTELLRHCAEQSGLKDIYFECKQTSEQNNIDGICEIICEKLGLPPLAFKSIEGVLDFLFQTAKGEPLILILDEYSYLRDVVAGLDSILQSLIGKYRKVSKIKFIICGSFVDTMKSLLAEENPLYGRIDLTINLTQMDFFEASLFYEGFSDEDKIRLYSVFGGVPYYNALVDSSKSVRENIIELIASNGARLENEVEMYLKSEISKITNANEVFETLAKGYTRFSDILSQSHVPSSPTLADILDRLIRMDVVKKVAPINDENNRKKSGYVISDNLSFFYYKYVFRNRSRLIVMEKNAFYDRFIAEDFETQFVPRVFEEICRQFLVKKNKDGNIAEPFEKIGKYYYDDPKTKTNGEFDIVTENGGLYTFYEAKFTNQPMTESAIAEEIAQVQRAGLFCRKYGFFSRAGFGEISEAQKNGLMLYDLRDLFEESKT